MHLLFVICYQALGKHSCVYYKILGKRPYVSANFLATQIRESCVRSKLVPVAVVVWCESCGCSVCIVTDYTCNLN